MERNMPPAMEITKKGDVQITFHPETEFTMREVSQFTGYSQITLRRRG